MADCGLLVYGVLPAGTVADGVGDVGMCSAAMVDFVFAVLVVDVVEQGQHLIQVIHLWWLAEVVVPILHAETSWKALTSPYLRLSSTPLGTPSRRAIS
ncbi:hypothetical protein LCGC14_2867620 [marine sediment metagenome]|uniref:Uncharacterized protein n=1 Tax=marine sediment metagenome TaxID=412755 RepID=A0A0F9AV11_9ZZZZ